MAIITLTTDFGIQDGFVGVMKGIILGIAPDTQIVDLSHQIAPQNVLQGARLLRRHTRYFPPETVHIGVVDPGVGTTRRALAARIGNQRYVGPDNGLFGPLIQDARSAGEPVEIVHLNNPDYWLERVSRTFHGRDLFAPVGAHLAAGASLYALGTPLEDPVMLDLPTPVQTGQGWRAQISGIDVFGNLATNLPADLLPANGEIRMKIKGVEILGLAASYGDCPLGELIALIDSEGYLEAAVVNGSAALRLGAAVGDEVLVSVRRTT